MQARARHLQWRCLDAQTIAGTAGGGVLGLLAALGMESATRQVARAAQPPQRRALGQERVLGKERMPGKGKIAGEDWTTGQEERISGREERILGKARIRGKAKEVGMGDCWQGVDAWQGKDAWCGKDLWCMDPWAKGKGMMKGMLGPDWGKSAMCKGAGHGKGLPPSTGLDTGKAVATWFATTGTGRAKSEFGILDMAPPQALLNQKRGAITSAISTEGATGLMDEAQAREFQQALKKRR